MNRGVREDIQCGNGFMRALSWPATSLPAYSNGGQTIPGDKRGCEQNLAIGTGSVVVLKSPLTLIIKQNV